MVILTQRRRLTVAVLVLVLAAGTVYAHRGATGIVKERMDAMMSLGDAMKALTAMMRGKRPYNVERVRNYATTVARHGSEDMTRLFPEGSLQHPTRAKPAIWADWEHFSALATELTVYAGVLKSAAANQRAPGRGGTTPVDLTPEELATMAPDAAFERLRRTCSDCHRTFRMKSELPPRPPERLGRLARLPGVNPVSTAAVR
ncbi:MAG: cytochrome c [Deltaproteobacteria bacterium]|nr:cytochrome c [Deltaproteobacteria bacterium]